MQHCQYEIIFDKKKVGTSMNYNNNKSVFANMVEFDVLLTFDNFDSSIDIDAQNIKRRRKKEQRKLEMENDCRRRKMLIS